MRKLLLLWLIPFQLTAQIPDYYLGIDFSQFGQALEEDLSALVIATHTHELDYTPEVWEALLQTDLDPENPEKVLLIYGFDDSSSDPRDHRTRDKDKSCHTSSCIGYWVREHSYPKSLGHPNLGTTGPGADAHHIRSIDYQKNNSRSNRPFADGEGNSHITPDGSFYPGDEWKGDIARMMMYMHIRYPERAPANNVGTGSHVYSSEMPDIFLEWNAEDPPTESEYIRNMVLEEMQGNRNPFIDNPYLATLIWGGPDAQDNWPDMGLADRTQTLAEVYPNPAGKTIRIRSNRQIEAVSLYTVTGRQLIGPEKLRSDSFDVTAYPDGSYLLIIHYKDRTAESKKILIRK